ncbi:unnamed protein product [Cylindrotheca closterium]|uniref:Transmembrane protein n=1 Tax=Cylindrotheca closterium TaxID=2856 RepID=A0AAD2FW08_9STRA|nr:unnamed protein product [Cylindrotheca closterium]
MTATDATSEPVTVELPSHDPKETEGLLIETTPNTAAPVENATQAVENAVTEASTATPTAPIALESFSSSQPSFSEETEEQEEKDDKEEELSANEQRVPVDIASQRRMEQEEEIKTSAKEVIEPMKLFRKGATAVVGGVTVAVGLVMIPLPTPMGCVVASSGMAILGSEFEGAKEMNDRMIEKSKTHLGNARDKAIAKIESMHSNDDTDDDSVDSEEEESPAWLKNMNEAERKRQRKLMKQKYRDETIPKNEQFKEYVTKRTSSFLNRSILPALHKTRDWGKEEKGTDKPAEGASENTEQKEVGTTSQPTASSTTPSPSESLQKGKEKMAESFEKGKEQVIPWFQSTSASFSNMMKRMSPQSGDDKKMDFDDEEIKFGENATEAKNAAFQDDLATATSDLDTTGMTSAPELVEPGAASVMAI